MSGKSAKTLKFSTLKVVAIETQGAYYRTAFTALAIGLSQVMIGAILMTTVMYSLYARNIHAALCTAVSKYMSLFSPVKLSIRSNNVTSYFFVLGTNYHLKSFVCGF